MARQPSHVMAPMLIHQPAVGELETSGGLRAQGSGLGVVVVAWAQVEHIKEKDVPKSKAHAEGHVERSHL